MKGDEYGKEMQTCERCHFAKNCKGKTFFANERHGKHVYKNYTRKDWGRKQEMD
jgi:hypothetical protein